MTSELHKIVATTLVFCVSTLMGNSIIMPAASSSANWTNDALEKLWQNATWVNIPGTPLARATRYAIKRAFEQIESEYRKISEDADIEMFSILHGCLEIFDDYFLISQPSYEIARKELLEGIDALISDTSSANFVKDHILPCCLQKFQNEINNNDDVWNLYFNPIAEKLIAQGYKGIPKIICVLRAWPEYEKTYTQLKGASRLANSEIAITSIPLQTFRNKKLGSLKNRSPFWLAGLQHGAVMSKDLSLSLSIYQTRELILNKPLYLNLTLQCTPTPDGARVRWQADEIGAYTSAFVAPYSGQALAAVLRALERQQHPDFRLADGDHAHLRAYGLLDADGDPVRDLPRRVGQALYAALVREQGMVAVALAQSQASATQRPLALRILIPPDAVELAALPWELLWPAQGLPLLFSAQPSLRFTRHLDLDGPLPAFAVRQGRPLRILALMPQVQRTPEDLAVIQQQVNQAWDTLRQRGLAEVTEISPVTRNDLARAMSFQPDIVQYTGHGWYAKGRGVLLLDPSAPGAPADLIDADQVAVALRGARMVVLAACRGAQGAGIEGGAASLLTGVAPALSAAGVPLVVGMQLGISVSSALNTSAALYNALAEGHSVQAAVGRARDELYVAEPERHAWYVPVLYVRTREAGPVFV